MEWTTGFYSDAPGVASAHRPKPTDSVTGTGAELWKTSGLNHRVVTDVRRGLALAVFGACYAADSELCQALTDVAGGDWAKLGMWHGSYSLVATRPNAAVVMGDLSGRTQIFWTRTDQGLYWSTAATPLAALINAKLDTDLLAGELVLDGFQRFLGQTPFEGVLAVPPGSMLQISGGDARIVPWYHPHREDGFDAAALSLREALLDGIDRRYNNSTGWSSDLSGGVDSSTLTVLAARRREVTAITQKTPWMSADDAHVAAKLGSTQPGVRHCRLPVTTSELVYADLDGPVSLPVTDLPTDDLPAAALWRRIAALAREGGSRLHLCGEGGDAVLDSSSASYIDELLAGRRLPAMRRIASEARRQRLSPIAAVLQLRAAAKRTGQAPHERVAQLILASACWDDEAIMDDYLPLAGVSWLTSDARSSLAGRVIQYQGQFGPPLSSHSDWVAVQQIAQNMSAETALFARNGIQLDLPYFDAPVLDACLSLPGYIRQPQGQFKPLVGRALGDVLPPSITTRISKGEGTLTAVYGMEQSAGHLRQLIDESQLVHLGIVKTDEVRQAFEQAICGLTLGDASTQLFVAIEHWLAGLDLGLASWWGEA